jgi:hypothetical protein
MENTNNFVNDITPGLQKPYFLQEYPDRPIYTFIPKCYNPSKPIGLFFFMHGGDKNSPPEQPEKLYLNTENGCLQPHIEDIPFITVVPAALTDIDGNRWNRKGVTNYILAVIEDCCKKFNIDKDRMILGGHSMGGFGAYHNGPLLADKFAGILFSAGAWLEEDFRACLGTNLYVMHGAWDCAYNYRGAHVEPRHHDWCGVSFGRAAHELMVKYDIEHTYDEHQGGHSLTWEPAQLSFRRFLTWAARQKRSPYSKRCAVVMPNGSKDPDLEYFNKSRWLEITQTIPGKISLDKIVLTGPNIAWNPEELAAQSYYLTSSQYEGARIVAENLGDNVISFDVENIKEFTCYLHPNMVDVNNKVTFIINGKAIIANLEKLKDNQDYTCYAKVSVI